MILGAPDRARVRRHKEYAYYVAGTLRGCERMGTGTSRHAGNCCFYAADSEPVPILSHALRVPSVR